MTIDQVPGRWKNAVLALLEADRGEEWPQGRPRFDGRGLPHKTIKRGGTGHDTALDDVYAALTELAEMIVEG